MNLKSTINLNNLDYKNKLSNLQAYLPNFKNELKLQNHKILINYQKNKLDFNGNGQLIIGDEIEMLNYKITKKNNEYIFDTNININNNSLVIDYLNYKKEKI